MATTNVRNPMVKCGGCGLPFWPAVSALRKTAGCPHCARTFQLNRSPWVRAAKAMLKREESCHVWRSDRESVCILRAGHAGRHEDILGGSWVGGAGA